MGNELTRANSRPRNRLRDRRALSYEQTVSVLRGDFPHRPGHSDQELRRGADTLAASPTTEEYDLDET